MKPTAWLVLFLLALAGSGGLAADEMAADAFAGAYLLVQHDGYQRIVTLGPGGTVSQVSDQESVLGFTGGRGAWQQTGPDKARARVIDFSYELADNARVGPSLIVYDLAFSDLVGGKYQKVSGRFAGKQFTTGQNPLTPSEPPIRTYGIAFQGQRITAK
jgi:hypothetical protein